MTAATAAGWVRAPAAPPAAAPLRAVDLWRADRAGDLLTVTARVAVRAEDLRGHFPGLPIYAGVFVIESVSQALALALATVPGQHLVLRLVRSVRFLAPALAGDELTLHIAASAADDGCWDVKATATRTDGTVGARLRAVFGLEEATDA